MSPPHHTHPERVSGSAPTACVLNRKGVGESGSSQGLEHLWDRIRFRGHRSPKELTEESTGAELPLPQTGLMVACYHGFGSVVALLSRCPFLDVNQQDKEGDTALMLAAQAGMKLLTPPSTNPPYLQTGTQPYNSLLDVPTPDSDVLGRGLIWGFITPFLGSQDLPLVFYRPRASGESPAQLLCRSGP